jgi:extracellular elastinolytic metalloproteinase
VTRTRATVVGSALLAVGALLAGGLPSSQAAQPTSAHLKRLLQGGDSGDFPGAEVPIGDVDRRGPRLDKLASSVQAVAALGSTSVSSWTRYGTPLSLMKPKGYLATGLSGSPATVARSFLRSNAAVWGLSAADVDNLALVLNEPLAGSKSAYSVSFNQKVNGILVSQDGYVVVGVVDGKVAGVTSSLVPTSLLGTLASSTPALSPAKAVLAAAKDAGISNLKLADLRVGKVLGDLQTVTAAGLHQLQYTRVRVLPTTDRGARLVYETAIQDVAGGRALAAQSQVDAITGKVLYRHDAVDTLAVGTASNAGMRSINTTLAPGALAAQVTPGTFQGYYSKKCSTPFVLGVKAGDKTLAITAASFSPSDDITISVYRNGVSAGNFDTGTSPEAGTVTFTPVITPAEVLGKKITAAVCPFAPASETGDVQFFGSFISTDADTPAVDVPAPLVDGTQTGPATWLAFASNPQLAKDGVVSKDDRYQVCSGNPAGTNATGKNLSKCNFVWGAVGKTDFTTVPGGGANPGFPSPYAYDISPVGAPSLTTDGNNALTTNAQLGSSLTPGAPLVPPVSPTRDYGTLPTDQFGDTWHTAKCNPASITPAGGSADVNAAIINLFVGHNRVHDFSYRLGLTEGRGIMQVSNFGKANGVPGAAAGDPELGNAQNAALTNNAFTVTNMATGPAAGVGLTGRDNANQVTLMDGVPGITNQYLFQPIVGFYAPCTDGDLDASVFLHEYTHATSNRLIAGPATSLGGQQGGSMGESWSDLTAIEYLNAFGLAGGRGEDPFALGAYATGDPVVGIRDYNLAPSKNPLNYSDFGFDTTGAEVHADGEIWNAVQMEIRQELIEKYDAQYPHTNKVLQKACALGVYDNGTAGPAWNKCPGNRRYITYQYDAMINQANGEPSMVDMRDAEMISIMMRDPADYDTVYNAFARRGLGLGAASKSSDDLEPTPSFASNKAANNAKVTFKLVDANTNKAVKGSVFVGMYSARCRPVATTLGAGHPDAKADIIKGSYTLTVQAKGYGIQRFTQTLTPGAKTLTLKLAQNYASSAFAPSVKGNTGAARMGNVIDDTEATNGAWVSTPVAGRNVTVTFGKKQTFKSLSFSALHHPAAALAEGGTEVEGRFIGVRAFDVQASGDNGATFKTIYTSSGSFFPSNAPRPTAPDLTLRTVTLPKPVTANAVRLVVRSNACTGGADFNHEQEDDPTNASDCTSSAVNTGNVTLAEFQVFRSLTTAGAIVIPPNIPGGGGNGAKPPLAATGGSTGLTLGGFALVGLAGAFWVLRRRTLRG